MKHTWSKISQYYLIYDYFDAFSISITAAFMNIFRSWFVSDSFLIHRTSTPHTWFTLRHFPVMIICFHSLTLFLLFLPLSSLFLYSTHIHLKNFFRSPSSLFFSLFSGLFCNTLHNKMLISKLRIDVRVYHCSEDRNVFYLLLFWAG